MVSAGLYRQSSVAGSRGPDVPVPLLRTEVKGQVVDCLADLKITQTYFNGESVPLECRYVFPLAEGAVLNKVTFSVGDRVIKAVVMEKQAAKATYTDAIAKGHGAALVEESEQSPDVFQTTVGNVLPGSIVTVELAVVQEVPQDGDGLRFHLPSHVAPRYGFQAPGSPWAFALSPGFPHSHGGFIVRDTRVLYPHARGNWYCDKCRQSRTPSVFAYHCGRCVEYDLCWDCVYLMNGRPAWPTTATVSDGKACGLFVDIDIKMSSDIVDVTCVSHPGRAKVALGNDAVVADGSGSGAGSGSGLASGLAVDALGTIAAPSSATCAKVTVGNLNMGLTEDVVVSIKQADPSTPRVWVEHFESVLEDGEEVSHPHPLILANPRDLYRHCDGNWGCDACGQFFSGDSRMWHCTTCPEWDLCDGCHAKLKVPGYGGREAPTLAGVAVSSGSGGTVAADAAHAKSGRVAVMASWFPNLGDLAKVNDVDEQPSEFWFVVDRSGSMGGSRMRNAQQTLQLALRSLPAGSTFQVLSFGSRFTTMFPGGPAEYNDGNLARATAEVDAMRADHGGTNILRPLQMIDRIPRSGGRPRQVFLITDGEVGDTRAVVAQAKRMWESTGTRFFTFGLGRSVSTALVQGVAKAGGGAFELITDGEEGAAAAKVMRQLARAQEPVLTDVVVDWGKLSNEVEVAPVRTTPVYGGGRVLMYAALKAGVLSRVGEGPFEATISAMLGRKRLSRSMAFCLTPNVAKDVGVAGNAPRAGLMAVWGRAIHSMAARLKIRELETSTALPEATRKRNAVHLATLYGVACRWASFVAVEVRATGAGGGAGPMVRRHVAPCSLGPVAPAPVPMPGCFAFGGAPGGAAALPCGGGAGYAHPAASARGFSFGAPAPAPALYMSPPFSFGGGGGSYAPPATNSAPAFSFGAPAPAPATASAFSFGAPAPAPATASAFSFGAPAQAHAPPSSSLGDDLFGDFSASALAPEPAASSPSFGLDSVFPTSAPAPAPTAMPATTAPPSSDFLSWAPVAAPAPTAAPVDPFASLVQPSRAVPQSKVMTEARPAAVGSSRSAMMTIVRLQRVDGSFVLSSELAAALGKSLDSVTKAVPAGTPTEVYATTLVVAFLRAKCADTREEWMLIEKKALRWLRPLLGGDAARVEAAVAHVTPSLA